MRSLAHAAKTTVAYALYYTGVLDIWQKVALRNRAVVLMYHRVLGDEDLERTGSHPGIIVRRDTFRQHMALVKRRFAVLTVEQLAAHLAGGRPLPNSSCVITFDDGWKDNLTEALPILREFGIPATIFLPVNFIGGKRLFWREALTHVLVDALTAARRRSDLCAPLRAQLDTVGLGGLIDFPEGDLRAAVVDAVAGAAQLRSSTAWPLLQAIEAIVGRAADPSETPDQFLAWDEVEAMAQAGVSFGGHGADHERLAEVSADTAREEVVTSMTTLRQRLGTPVVAFSYPNGSFDDSTVALVRDAGFAVAFTTREGWVRSTNPPLTLPRINVHQSASASQPLFLARILGLF